VIPEIRVEILTDTYGRFVMEPLEAGFGITVGNALRRVLLSSLPGAAVTWVRIDEAQHEFSTIPHMREDTIEFLLNVKELRLRPVTDRPGKLYLEIRGEGEVTAADIQPGADFEIINPELHLASLDSPDAALTVEMNVERGQGFVAAGLASGLPIGVIPVDAVFTPIRRVNYVVENTRVEQVTNYDRLVLEVWTDGAIAPLDAVSQSAQLLLDHFTVFRNLGQTRPADTAKPIKTHTTAPPEIYDLPIEELQLSVRAYNALKRNNITKVGQILDKNEDELLHIRNFGEKSLSELKERLTVMGIAMPSPGAEADVADLTDVSRFVVTVERPPSAQTQLPTDQLAKLARLREELGAGSDDDDEDFDDELDDLDDDE